MYLTDVLCQDRACESPCQHPVRRPRGRRGGLPGHRGHHEGRLLLCDTISSTIHFKHSSSSSEFYSSNIMCCVIWKNAGMRLVMLGGGWKKVKLTVLVFYPRRMQGITRALPAAQS